MSENPTVGFQLGRLHIQHVRDGVAFTLENHTEIVSFADLDSFLDYVGSVSVEERRAAFRVPVPDSLREILHARVRFGGRPRKLGVLDLSLTGCRTEAPMGWTLPDDPFPMGLRMDKHRVVLTAVVVRQNRNFVALRFEDSMKDGMLCPPEHLVRIQRQLELIWLRERVSP